MTTHPRVRELSLPIEGMSCTSCAGRVEKALRAVPGVLEARCQPGNRTRDWCGQRRRADIGALVQAVAKAGYSADAGTGAQEAAAPAGSGHARRLADRHRRRADRAAGAADARRTVRRCTSCCRAGCSWLLATPVQFWIGARFYRAGVEGAAGAGPATWTCWWRSAPRAAYGLSVFQWLAQAAAATCTSKRRRSSSRWSGSANGWKRAPSARPRKRSARCRRCARPPRGCAADGEERDVPVGEPARRRRSGRSAPASACRWTAW